MEFIGINHTKLLKVSMILSYLLIFFENSSCQPSLPNYGSVAVVTSTLYKNINETQTEEMPKLLYYDNFLIEANYSLEIKTSPPPLEKTESTRVDHGIFFVDMNTKHCTEYVKTDTGYVMTKSYPLHKKTLGLLYPEQKENVDIYVNRESLADTLIENSIYQRFRFGDKKTYRSTFFISKKIYNIPFNLSKIVNRDYNGTLLRIVSEELESGNIHSFKIEIHPKSLSPDEIILFKKLIKASKFR